MSFNNHLKKLCTIYTCIDCIFYVCSVNAGFTAFLCFLYLIQYRFASPVCIPTIYGFNISKSGTDTPIIATVTILSCLPQSFSLITPRYGMIYSTYYQEPPHVAPALIYRNSANLDIVTCLHHLLLSCH